MNSHLVTKPGKGNTEQKQNITKFNCDCDHDPLVGGFFNIFHETNHIWDEVSPMTGALCNFQVSVVVPATSDDHDP